MLIAYVAIVIHFFLYVIRHFWHICKKSKNKDFGGVIVENSTFLRSTVK